MANLVACVNFSKVDHKLALAAGYGERERGVMSTKLRGWLHKVIIESDGFRSVGCIFRKVAPAAGYKYIRERERERERERGCQKMRGWLHKVLQKVMFFGGWDTFFKNWRLRRAINISGGGHIQIYFPGGGVDEIPAPPPISTYGVNSNKKTVPNV